MASVHCRPRRPVLVLVLALGFLVVLITVLSVGSKQPRVDELNAHQQDPVRSSGWLNLGLDSDLYGVTPASVRGNVVMSELGNSTIRAELGRASWRLLHTMASRYPKRPTEDEREALRSFIYLFARLYPCGQCARHFQVILANNPPEVSSRNAVSQWACRVHNVVNKRLDKPLFDCSQVQKQWKCGCADADDEEDDDVQAAAGDKASATDESIKSA
ncbi:ERV/ALR sulfhydryl oxidase domain-containing protein [Thamnocephalis sphaerospora]|uniref:Sulfhydryl oxidase n=1 Tax=Thamnocephalis sphaerospora TaxID=78915 RepID=A0A4P9XYF8_9FUNG|nr:ERV/ALR sulfhydryl oxidase domain-containing protein [Thamnocephalis sphaerospora]|eukprot:RKP11142.1 ERV/ALR sulfhydryl oxidase domain-containing protein [Thamnocephalis sphaerospora]